MGALFSQQTKVCNYHCPICKTTGAMPNIAGRFFIINDTQCQCNGCNTIFEKDLFYAQPDNPTNLDGPWSCPKMNMINETGTQPDSVVQ
uniref:Uncharacterized protein n=1 Tax=viral metagenome TaxID=1070528 RepID=A0A6C0HHE0_9ZZZZ